MSFVGTVLTGKQFNELKLNVFKLTNEDENDSGYQYKDGLNKDTLLINEKGECSKGGLYFIELNKIGKWLILCKWIRKVIIPNDAVVYVELDKYRSSDLYLEKRQDIADFEYWKDIDFCRIVLRDNGFALKYIKEQTYELCKIALRENGRSLLFVNEQTPELCKIAVEQNGIALKFVKNQTNAICLSAVKQYGYALAYVLDQTKDICDCAIKQDKYASQYIKKLKI